jgi:hypothetical protein
MLPLLSATCPSHDTELRTYIDDPTPTDPDAERFDPIKVLWDTEARDEVSIAPPVDNVSDITTFLLVLHVCPQTTWSRIDTDDP